MGREKIREGVERKYMYDRKKNSEKYIGSGYIEKIGNKKGKNTTVGEAWKNCEPIVRGIISGGGKKSRRKGREDIEDGCAHKRPIFVFINRNSI